MSTKSQSNTSYVVSCAWWCTSIIPVLLKQENGKFQASLGYIVKLCLKKTKAKKKKKVGRGAG
jgi:hypothetical protein